MNKDQGIGAVILLASVAGIVLYAWLIYAFAILVLQITAFIAVAGILGIAAWIGWRRHRSSILLFKIRRFLYAC